MRLHVGRHDGSLPNKCDLCPRSFEGPKALKKHKEANKLGRFFQPKSIINADGTKAMLLPTKTGLGGHGGIRTSTKATKRVKTNVKKHFECSICNNKFLLVIYL